MTVAAIQQYDVDLKILVPWYSLPIFTRARYTYTSKCESSLPILSVSNKGNPVRGFLLLNHRSQMTSLELFPDSSCLFSRHREESGLIVR